MEKSCGVVLYKEGDPRQYLLLHYPEGHWDFPKGHVEEGETEIDTALRETKEETGITDVEIDKGFREKISYFYTRDGKSIYKEVIYFVGKTNAEDLELSHEHVGGEWMPYLKAVERLTFKNAKELLKKTDLFLQRT